MTPVGRVVYRDQVTTIKHDGDQNDAVGPVLRKLYDRIRRIQNGEEPDKFNWLYDL